MRVTRIALGLLVAAVVGAASLSADDLSVVVVPGADLGGLRTFSLRHYRIQSTRPELDNPLFAKKLNKSIRAALKAKGLTEAATGADVLVDVDLTGEDFAVGAPPPARGLGPQPERFTQGTLVIDLFRPTDKDPVWRGVYRDDESTGSKLMQKLPDDAAKLIDRFPKRP